MKEQHIPITISAPYFTLNELTDQTKTVWICFHGYGQLVRYWISKFEILDPLENFVLAPQGLSKFYQNGFFGRVGATWMTKEDRLTEIDNQYSYIEHVLKSSGDLSGKKLVFFGFSQGVATMVRYAATSKRPFSKMIIWAGTFPPDIQDGGFDFLTGEEEIVYYTSKEDPFFEESMIEKQNQIVKETIGKLPELRWYEGGHKVIPELLPEI